MPEDDAGAGVEAKSAREDISVAEAILKAHAPSEQGAKPGPQTLELAQDAIEANRDHAIERLADVNRKLGENGLLLGLEHNLDYDTILKANEAAWFFANSPKPQAEQALFENLHVLFKTAVADETALGALVSSNVAEAQRARDEILSVYAHFFTTNETIIEAVKRNDGKTFESPAEARKKGVPNVKDAIMHTAKKIIEEIDSETPDMILDRFGKNVVRANEHDAVSKLQKSLEEFASDLHSKCEHDNLSEETTNGLNGLLIPYANSLRLAPDEEERYTTQIHAACVAILLGSNLTQEEAESKATEYMSYASVCRGGLIENVHALFAMRNRQILEAVIARNLSGKAGLREIADTILPSLSRQLMNDVAAELHMNLAYLEKIISR